MSELSTRVRLRREELGLSQEQLAQRMGYRSKSSITKLEKGVNDIPQAKLEELAAALETTPAYLLGLDVPCPPPGFEPLPAMAMVPLVGSIACGTPITAEQNIEQYIGVPAAWHADFALTCHGDSMAPTICDGDIVCIRCQPERLLITISCSICKQKIEQEKDEQESTVLQENRMRTSLI